ncbi:terminase small subunit [Chryseobacterium gambrini]|uniref:terminase small subunit n=1 Tax=Chryseobacterium gambrini TaxID=373672 RepID=UPI003D0DF9CA
MKLTDKQERFCREYIIDLNATQAAIRAGYSKKVAGSIGFENLKKPEIEKYILSLREKKSAELDFSFERLANELAKVAFGDVKNYFDGNGRLIDINELESAVSASIKGVTVQQEKIKTMGEVIIESSVKKVESYDKLKAIELLGKMFGHFSKDNEQKKGESQVTVFQLPNNNR